MKKLWLIGTALAALIIIFCLIGSSVGAAGTNNTVVTSQQQGISVTGEGKVTVTPDIVNINMGVQSTEASVSDALKKTSDAMAKIMDALKANNIADKDIQTQQFNVYPQYSYDQTNGNQSITGYNVNNTVNVKLRDINHVGALIDAVVTAGGNLTVISNVNFTVEDPTKYYDDARQKAVADAAQKAQDIANSYGVALGKPILVVETSVSQNPYNNYYNVSAGPSVNSSDSGNSFNAGSTDIILDVQASYAITKK
jgi:uncharacterized protein YggE